MESDKKRLQKRKVSLLLLCKWTKTADKRDFPPQKVKDVAAAAGKQHFSFSTIKAKEPQFLLCFVFAVIERNKRRRCFSLFGLVHLLGGPSSPLHQELQLSLQHNNKHTVTELLPKAPTR